jgi:hypothetical protein
MRRRVTRIRRLAGSMVSVTVPMMKQVHEWACKDEKKWKDAEQMSSVFGPQEKSRDGEESNQHPPVASRVHLHVV